MLGLDRESSARQVHKQDPWKAFWKLQVNGVPCGAKHNSLIHGSTSSYCNLVQVNSASAGSGGAAPPLDEMEEADAEPRALMQIQWLEVEGKDVSRSLVFWDAKSNVNLVRKEFAELAELEGRTVVQQLQTTGRGAEE